MVTLPISPSSGLNNLHKLTRACTHCGSNEIYRQRPRGLVERHVYKAFHFAPYWCAGCDKRFYLRHRHAAAGQHT
ncbi:MAG: hypothetical protein WAK48_31490 [Candidatus Acidiferrum sp.]|jgi:DNA-directed RNA polymerase subunit RPC12/RpoP